MSLLFDFKDWILTLFDNLLILCHMYDDNMDKLRKVRDRCNERNVVLKFSKSTLASLMLSSLAIKSRTASGAWMMTSSWQ